MIAEEVLALDRQREEQAQAAEQAKLNAERDAKQAKAAANRKAFIKLLYECYDERNLAPETTLKRLDECEHTAAELHEALDALKERDELAEWLKANPEKETRAMITQRLEDARKAVEEATLRHKELSQNFTQHITIFENRQADRHQMEDRVTEVDDLFPRPTKKG